MIHGWTFSGRFFSRNVDALAEGFRVITLDLRGHGDSEKPGHGYRVPRLAKDLADLLDALDLKDATVLGWSLGCPVIWSCLELFGDRRLARAVFVQQSPRQYYALEWKFAHASCYDDASLANTQAEVRLNTAEFDRQQLAAIMATEPADGERELFLSEMAKPPPEARNAIMADHTRHDWRDPLPKIQLPSLVLVACRDGVLPWQGPAYVGEAIPNAETVFFEESSHALFLDEPEKFNEAVRGFAGREARSSYGAAPTRRSALRPPPRTATRRVREAAWPVAQAAVAERMLGALVGALVALFLSQVLFPPSPVSLLKDASRRALGSVAEGLRGSARALASGDAAQGRAARCNACARRSWARWPTLPGPARRARRSPAARSAAGWKRDGTPASTPGSGSWISSRQAPCCSPAPCSASYLRSATRRRGGSPPRWTNSPGDSKQWRRTPSPPTPDAARATGQPRRHERPRAPQARAFPTLVSR